MGESVAVDPMGVAFAAGNEREELIPVYVDTDRIKEVESKLPSFKDRRPALYISFNRICLNTPFWEPEKSGSSFVLHLGFRMVQSKHQRRGGKIYVSYLGKDF